MKESSSKTLLYFNLILHKLYALLLSQLANMLDWMIILFLFKINWLLLNTEN